MLTPNAENTGLWREITVAAMPSRRATPGSSSPPPPPYATRVSCERETSPISSWTCSRPSSATMPAAAIFSASSQTASAACSTDRPSGSAKVASGAPREVHVQPLLATQVVVGVEVAEHEPRVGGSRLAPAQAEARRARCGSCALRSELEPAFSGARDRAAADRERQQLDRRLQDRYTTHFDRLAEHRLAAGDQSDIGARAADVGGDRVLDPQLTAQQGARVAGPWGRTGTSTAPASWPRASRRRRC